MKVQRCHHIYVDAPVCNKIWCRCWCWIISATDKYERHLVLLRPLLVSQSSVRRSLHTPPTRTPVKHRRNKSWREIFERYNKRSSLRKQIQYQGEFCNMRVCFNCRLDHWNCYYINIRFFLVMSPSPVTFSNIPHVTETMIMWSSVKFSLSLRKARIKI